MVICVQCVENGLQGHISVANMKILKTIIQIILIIPIGLGVLFVVGLVVICNQIQALWDWVWRVEDD